MAAIEFIPCGDCGSYSVCSVEEVKGREGLVSMMRLIKMAIGWDAMKVID